MNDRFGLQPQPQPQPRKAKPRILWLLAGPLVGGILTHWWDLILLDKYYSLDTLFNSHVVDGDFIYFAEVAPKLRRHKRIVGLDEDDSSWSDGIDVWFPKPDEDDNERYQRHRSEDDGECISMHSWQESSFPSCNLIHEMDFFSKYRPGGDVTHVTHGGFNELYRYKDRYINSTGSIASISLAVKILKYEKDYTAHKFGVVRQDAVTLERLSKSPYIYNLYGYCGFALVVPFVTGGNLNDKLYDWRHGDIEISSRERLQYAVDMARGLRDLHDIDGDGVPSATHGDLKEHQYLFGEDGRLQLGDFNKGQFLSKSSTTGKPCTYKPPSTTYNDKVFRSPEEYMNIQQTAATDIFAFGSLMYYLLTRQRVWEGMTSSKYRDKVRKLIIEGKRPEIKDTILKSQDPVDVALKKAYEMCSAYDPEKRVSAKEVAEFLEGVWKQLY
ncbi:hypothetical protein HJC23_006502 [Cyclotella cryptica]|uniref:Protein kinase domain-containing protein n=1 Tax=Cyclotella cryptica TaxID=29204 RepID=A0ABD3PNJ9_9STRA|eukprot:CCRYP_012977-RA/>CCRYP_012977-RA protein AED:0.27 eAED:0.27 QI:239/1/1/1/1/1/2/520/440